MNNFFRLKPLSILCLSLASLTIFSACRDDIADAPDREYQGAQIKATEDYIGKVNIAIEADVIPMSDQEGRGLNYNLIDRSKKIEVDGNTVPSGVDYTDEVAPRMYLEEGSTERGYLIFYHDDGTVVRKAVAFTVIEGVKKKDGSIDPTAKNRVQYVGDIEFPSGVTLKDEFDSSINSTFSVCPNRNEHCDKLWISIIAETQSYRSDTCNLFKFFAKIIIFCIEDWGSAITYPPP